MLFETRTGDDDEVEAELLKGVGSGDADDTSGEGTNRRETACLIVARHPGRLQFKVRRIVRPVTEPGIAGPANC